MWLKLPTILLYKLGILLFHTCCGFFFFVFSYLPNHKTKVIQGLRILDCKKLIMILVDFGYRFIDLVIRTEFKAAINFEQTVKHNIIGFDCCKSLNF